MQVGLSLRFAAVSVASLMLGRRLLSWIWAIRSAQRRRVPIKLVSAQNGTEVNILQMLAEIKSKDLWILAYDLGEYRLHVGELSIGLTLRRKDEFGLMLSHRWHPRESTTRGLVPVPMLQAQYPDPVWVDFLNHFNVREHIQRCFEESAHMYATKRTRALYLEQEHSHTGLAAVCSRTWLWQELSVGPQRHLYNSVHSVWMHAAVMFGAQEFQSVLFDWLDAAQLLASLIYHKKLSERRSRTGPVSTLQRLQEASDDVEHCLLQSCAKADPRHIEADADAQREHDTGTTSSLLSYVLARKGYSQSEAFVAAVADATGCDFNTPPAENALQSAVELIRQIAAIGLDCVRDFHSNTSVHGPDFEVAAFRLRVWVGLARRTQRRGEIPVRVSEAAIEMARARATGWMLSAAVCNFGNKNISCDSDRLEASFGVLCAASGVVCSPPNVSKLIYQSEAPSVTCLPHQDAHSVVAVTRRMVSLSVNGVQRIQPSGWAAAAMSVLRGSLRWVATGLTCEDVELSGMALGQCRVMALERRSGAVLDAIAGNPPRWSELWGDDWQLCRWSVGREGSVSVALLGEDDTMLCIDSLGAVAGGAHKFKAWQSKLPVAVVRKTGPNGSGVLQRGFSLHSRFPHPWNQGSSLSLGLRSASASSQAAP